MIIPETGTLKKSGHLNNPNQKGPTFKKNKLFLFYFYIRFLYEIIVINMICFQKMIPRIIIQDKLHVTNEASL